ncbi:hypothetical protein [Paramagnetospirillum caucaseum]|nr:hypothetical protein [Paramagnetospirillum caucaseum]
MRRFCFRSMVAVVFVASIGVMSATAADISSDQKPSISGTVNMFIADRWRYAAEDKTQRNDLFVFVEPFIKANFNKELSIQTLFTYDPAVDPHPDESRAFANEQLHLKNLVLDYSKDEWGVYGGRFAAEFGQAWLTLPGYFGRELAEDNAIWDRNGVGGWMNVKGGETGTVRLAASAFMLDTTIMSKSWIGTPTRTRKRQFDGGQSNTGRLDSFALSATGTKLPSMEGFSWHTGVLRQEVRKISTTNSDIPDAELGVVGGIRQEWKFDDWLVVAPMFEYQHFWNRGGVQRAERDYISTGMEINPANWRLSVGYTLRISNAPNVEEKRDYLFNTSLGYEFGNGVRPEIGYRVRSIDSLEVYEITSRILYVYKF